jgi:hypothetical protein
MELWIMSLLQLQTILEEELIDAKGGTNWFPL